MDPRPAATVIVARAAVDDGSPEFLALRRSPGSRFAPGVVVFPGGVVEERDGELARRWFGSSAEAARACAVRELAEESGLVLTAEGLVAAPGRLPGDPGFPPPAVGQLPEMARWVAPTFLPVRFDARFFALEAAGSLQPTPDGVEVDRAWWAHASELLEQQARGEVVLLWPTLKTLEALTGCRSVAEVLALRVEQSPPPITSAPRTIAPSSPGTT